MSYRDETEPSHYPHMEREMRPLTVVNGTQKTTWFPRRMDLPPMENHGAADEGGTFRDPAPARVPRRERLQFDGFPLIGLALVFGLGVPLLIALWDVVAGFFK